MDVPKNTTTSQDEFINLFTVMNVRYMYVGSLTPINPRMFTSWFPHLSSVGGLAAGPYSVHQRKRSVALLATLVILNNNNFVFIIRAYRFPPKCSALDDPMIAQFTIITRW